PKDRHTSDMASPSSSRATNRSRSSITEHSFQGIATPARAKGVTHVSGTIRHLSLGSLTTTCRIAWHFVDVLRDFCGRRHEAAPQNYEFWSLSSSSTIALRQITKR
ncbi:MAG: hypothetical protein ACREMY_30060, partial [bacterium]